MDWIKTIQDIPGLKKTAAVFQTACECFGIKPSRCKHLRAERRSTRALRALCGFLKSLKGFTGLTKRFQITDVRLQIFCIECFVGWIN
mgnify:CR=1 FL=1